jgi:nucleotide-binding universal stress UspA family protein
MFAVLQAVTFKDGADICSDGWIGRRHACVTFAAHLAAAVHLPLSIATVSNPVPSSEWREFARMENMSRGDLIELEAQDVPRNARQRATELNAPTDKLHALVGDAAEELLALIESHKPDVLILGRRGRGRLTGLLLGSVSQKLASLSPVPVTIVP